MKRRTLLVSTAILALGTGGCDDSSSATGDATGFDSTADIRSEETVQPLRPEEAFKQPVVTKGFPTTGITSVASADGATVWMGSAQGLYKATAPAYEAQLVRGYVVGRPSRYISSVVVRDNGEIVALDGAFGVASSLDAGDTWTAAPPFPSPEAFRRPHLVTDGQHVILVAGNGPLYIQRATGEPWSPLTVERPNMAELHAIDIDAVAFSDNGKLYANSGSYFGAGVHQVELAVATEPGAVWTPVGGLDATWGYSAFAFAGGKGITANDTEFFVREADVWRKSVTLDFGHHSEFEPPIIPAQAIATDGTTFLASGTDGLRRSMDGVAWQRLPAGHAFGDTFIGDTWGFFGAAGGNLCGSTDTGDTWNCHGGPIATAQDLLVVGSEIITFNWGGLTAGRGTYQTADAEALAFGVPSYAEQLVAANGALWTVTREKQIFGNIGPGKNPQPLESDWGPNGNANAYKRLFGNAVGLFAANRIGSTVTGPYCGLSRHVPESDVWAKADFRLPGVEGCDAAVMTLTEAGGVLFVGSATGETYRSVDQGAHWTHVHDNVITAVAECAGRFVALTDNGHLLYSNDRGETFKRDTSFAQPSASSLVSAADWCVVGLESVAGGPTLWAQSPNGNDFTPLAVDFIEPVVALAASAETLAVSTASVGIVRIDIRR